MEAGGFTDKPVHGWYVADLKPAALSSINTSGTTQFRLSYRKSDKDNKGADYIKFYNGNADDADKPALMLRYYIP
jgi:hypothetical protein